MLQTLPEGKQLESVEAQLTVRFGDKVPAETVHAEVEASYAGFKDARIRTYVPVLVQREASLKLLAYA